MLILFRIIRIEEWEVGQFACIAGQFARNFLRIFVITRYYYSERQKKVVMVKEPALSRKSPHPPFVKGGQGGISGYPFARLRKSVAVMSTYLGRSL